MRALDLFCGAGLASAGARDAGAQLIAAADLCPIAAATYAANFPGTTVINRRLEDISPGKLREKIGKIDLLLASPECTNHTCAKGSAPRSEYSRETALQVVRFAKSFVPRWIVIENVVSMRPWARYKELIERIKAMGYSVREQVLDASKFGVPQKRRRLFVMCDKDNHPPLVAVPLSASALSVRSILDGNGMWSTTPLKRRGRALDTLARARRATASLGEKEPFLIVYYGTDGSGGWQSLDRPLRTVTTVDRFALVQPGAHGHEMRMLQVPELKRAMGLNDAFQFPKGTRRDQIRLLGNGVCPPVMREVIRALTRG